MSTPHLNRRISVTLAALLLSSLALSPAWATSHRLLDETEAYSQLVLRPQVSPDGQWVVYDAAQGNPSSRSLYSAPVAGGDEVQLAHDFAGVAKITADSTRVVYLKIDTSVGFYGLFSMPIEGGATIQLNDDLSQGGQISSTWSLTADGQRAIFRSQQDEASAFELFSVSVLGGPVTRLNGDLVAGGNVNGFILRPHGSSLIYRADQAVDGATEIFTVPIAGGVATRLNTPFMAGSTIQRYGVSPDDTKAFYIADQDTDGVFELYGVALTGAAAAGEAAVEAPVGAGSHRTELEKATLEAGPAIKLNDPLVSGGDVSEAVFSPDSSWVVFRADADVDFRSELFSVPSAGGQVTKVNDPLVTGGSVLSFSNNWQVDPSSQRVIYRADQDVNTTFELYSAALTGGDVSKLNLPLGLEGGVEGGFTISDGRVVFRSDAETENIFELYSAPLGGGTAIKLNPPLMFDLANSDSVEDNFLVSLGDVFYEAPIGSLLSGIHRVSITGGASTQLSLPTSFVSDFFLSSDGSDLFYTAPVVPGLIDLYRRPATLPGMTVQLNGPASTETGRIGQIEVSEAADRVIYSASRSVQRSDLFSLPLTGGPPEQLNVPTVAGSFVEFFYVSPDGQHVVYAAAQDIPKKIELYSTPVEGGEPVKLNIPVAEGGGSIFRLPYPYSPDGNTVVYRVYEGSQSECDEVLFSGFELFSVAAQGGTPSPLHPSLGTCIQAFDYVISPTSDRVVYSIQDWNSFTSRLMSVPLGGGTSVQLGPDFILDFYQNQLRISPDGSTLVYRAQPNDGTRSELFSVPMAGGQPVRLVDPLPDHAEIWFEWDLSPDGSQVVYLSDTAVNGRLALSSVPITGGASIELSGDMVDDGDVDEFAMSSSFGRVVFTADRNVDGVMELFSVSLVGGEVTRLNPPLTGTRRVNAFAISEDSNHVVFRVRGLDGYSALFRAPLAGGPVTELSHGLAADQFISSFKINQQSTHVVYSVQDGGQGFGVHYRVPITGGGAVRFSPSSLAAEGDFDTELPETWLSPDGSRLIYSGGQQNNLSTDLWLSEELDLFLDGFESGDTIRWSSTVPNVP